MPSIRALPRRWWIAPLVVLLLLAAYTLAGFFGVPRLARSLIQSQVEKLGGRVEVGEIRFNPFSFEAHLAAFKLTEADGAPLLAFESLVVDVGVWRSIREGGAVLQTLRWTGPDLALVVERDGSVNLARLAPPSREAEPAEPRSVPYVRIADLSIERGRIGIEDRSRPQAFKFTLAPVAFTLKDFRTAEGHASAYAFIGAATSGEELEWSGDFTVQPIGSSGRFALKNLQASTIASYAQDLLPMRLVSGVAETAGEYRLSLDPALSLDLKLPAVRLRDWAVAERGGKTAAKPPLSIAEIGLHEVQVSLARREVSLKSLSIDGLRADVRREADGTISLSRLFPAPRAKAATKAARTAVGEPAPWRLAVGSTRLVNAAVALEDRAVRPAVQLALQPISATVEGYSTEGSAPVQLAAKIGLGKAGRLHLRGPLRVEPLSMQLDVDLQGLDLKVVQPYLAQRSGLALKSARLGVKGALDYRQPAGAAAQLSFTGAAQLADLSVQDRASKQDLLKWRELKVTGIDFRQAPERLNIERVDLLQPYARVVVTPERELNLARALAPPAGATPGPPPPAPGEAPPASAKSDAMQVRIAQLRIDAGQLSFADLSIEPQFAAGIVGLKGDITGLSTDPASRAKVDLQGRVDEFSPVTIQGDINPLAPDRYTDIAMSFRNMDLIRFNPYSGRFAGYNIVKGKLTTDLTYRVRDRALEAEHHVLLDQLEFGEATGSKDAVPLPVKLAVALLKDRHGLIELGLPVRGNLDDPTFRVGPLVWKVLVNLLSKAVTAPFAALGALFGGGDELAYVEFAPGSAQLSVAETEKLDKLGKALVERPQLRLDVPYAIADAEDGKALARAELERRLVSDDKADAGVAPETGEKNRLRALEGLHGELLGDKPGYPPEVEADRDARPRNRIAYLEQVLKAKLAPDAAVLERLAGERARSVQAALLANPDLLPERLFLTSRRASLLSAAGAVRMELSLR